MSPDISRRDILKLASLLPLGLAPRRAVHMLNESRLAPFSAPNVIVLVFDAWSALNDGLYGYHRKTTPNLEKLAKQAVVYHNHFAGGNFTTPGTASLLTGVYPWTHRALLRDGRVVERFIKQNLFSALPDYYRLAYTHNLWANTLLDQFAQDIEELLRWDRLFLRSDSDLVYSLFNNDQDIASVSWARGVKLGDQGGNQGFAYSLFWSHLFGALQDAQLADLKPLYPRGLPGVEPDLYFRLEDGIDWLVNRLPQTPRPFLGYFHFLPPHAPYRTSAEFYNRFQGDGYFPVSKPEDVFTERVQPQTLLRRRFEYDEFILYVDQQFGRLYDALESTGMLDDTWIFLTSDHGEMFERGIWTHGNPTLYQPVVRVPLIIFEPGRQERIDVQNLTSAVDLVPTLAHVTGHKIPNWTEGITLPPYAETNHDPERSVFAVQANRTLQGDPLTRASIMLVKDSYKLHYCFGYDDRGVDELIMLYDIQADPEELADLTGSHKETAEELLAELKNQLAMADQPYR